MTFRINKSDLNRADNSAQNSWVLTAWHWSRLWFVCLVVIQPSAVIRVFLLSQYTKIWVECAICTTNRVNK